MKYRDLVQFDPIETVVQLRAADERAEAVRITNIHRMKGLENDVVIVPDLVEPPILTLPS